MGRSAPFLMSSRGVEDSMEDPNGGTYPVNRMMESKEAFRNPRIGTRGAVVLLGDWTFAEPVPVRRPGVCVTGVEDLEGADSTLTVSETGSTNIGLNLVLSLLVRE